MSCTIELYSEVSKLLTSYDFIVILSKETETSLNAENDADGQDLVLGVNEATEDTMIDEETAES